MYPSFSSPHRLRRTAFNLAARALWRMPASFEIANMLTDSYSLRCIVFHNICAKESSFTRGMCVNTSPEQLEAKLKFIVKYYSPVGLEEVFAAADGAKLPPRAMLVTFDDAYASFAQLAAPMCARYKVPAVFF